MVSHSFYTSLWKSEGTVTMTNMFATLLSFTCTLMIQNTLAQDCTLITGEGSITSPNYPSDYSSYADICWMFTADEGKNAMLTFDSMEMETTSDCRYDVLRIYDNFVGESQQSCQLCERLSIPDPVTSTGQQLMVQFITDGSVEYQGFSARFESVDGVAVPVDMCDPGWLPDATNYTDTVDVDVDINYPDYPDYPGYIYPEPDYSHITLPDESCDDDEMYDAVQNVLNKLRNFRYNEFYYLASAYQPSGINIESTEDVRRVACFMSDIDSVEQIAQLYIGLPSHIFIHQFHAVAPHLKMLSPGALRQGLLSVRKLIQWIEKTGFPQLPLVETTYADTWEFFTELQSQLPESIVLDVMSLYSMISTDPEISPLVNFFTTSPEVLARVSHDDDNAIAPLESLFNDSYGVSHIQMLRRIPMGVFGDIEHIYTPFLIAVLEFETIIHERGWFDL